MEFFELFKIHWFAVPFFFVWGLLWGSFFNVCIHRIPLDLSIVYPRSHCVACQHLVRAYDNVPVLSWLMLRGRCRDCKTVISWQYPLIELLSAIAAALLYYKFVRLHPTPVTLSRFMLYFSFVGCLLVLAAIDKKHYILPDKITLPCTVVLGLWSIGLGEVSWLDSLVGCILGYGSLRLISDGYRWMTGREGLGYGDAKLFMMCGAVLGWKSLIPILLFGSLLGIVVSIPLLMVLRKKHSLSMEQARVVPVPFGLFLAVGAALVVFMFVGHSYEEIILRIMSEVLGQ